ncbi:MAG TPA: LysM domain-containing protein [Stenomitos sp.]
MSIDVVQQGSSPAPKQPKRQVGDIISDGLDTADGRHVVRQGETARGIAKHFQIPWDTFQAWNPHIFTDKADERGRKRSKDGHWVYPGDKIRLKPPASSDQADLQKAKVAHAKRVIDTSVDQLGQETDKLKASLIQAEQALKKIPANDPDRAKYEAKVEKLRTAIAALEAPEKPEPTAEQKAIAQAKETLGTLGGQLAETHGHNKAKADQLMGQAQEALGKIPANDPERQHFEGVVADMQKLYDAYFPKPKPEEPKPKEDPAVAKRRKELDTYLDKLEGPAPRDPQTGEPVPTPSRSASVTALVASQPEVVAAATPAQKARLLSLLMGRRGDDVVSLIGGGSMNDKAKRAALDVLKAAGGQKQLTEVLDVVKGKKQLDDLFSQMGDRAPGVEMAKLFMDQGVYKGSNNYYKEMDDDAARALLRASGYVDPPPPTLESAFLKQLDAPVRQHMIEELSSGSMSWEESRMIPWLSRQVPDADKTYQVQATETVEPQAQTVEPPAAEPQGQSQEPQSPVSDTLA